ncbi:MAG: hypothetical protein MUC92_00210 [Fimbriimonadaceae bacterium]|nr:hypothetical protein [Fimbriimonadaceae bacterium]
MIERHFDLTAPFVADYSLAFSPFVDRFSQFSVQLLEGGKLGLGALHPRACLGTAVIANPVLRPTIDGAEICGRSSAQPHLVTQEGSQNGLNLQLKFAFENEQILHVVVDFHNRRDTEATLALDGVFLPDQVHGMLQAFPGTSSDLRRSLLEIGPDGRSLTFGYLQTSGDLPSILARLLVTSHGWAFACEEGSHHYQLRKLSPIVSGESGRLALTLTLTHRDHPFRQPCLTFDEIISQGQELTNSIQTDHPHESRARFALLRCSARGTNTDLGDVVANLCTSDASDFSCTFFWDSLFSARALARFHPEAAKGAIEAVLAKQLARDGSSPERGWLMSVPHRMLQHSPQPPIATEAVIDVWDQTGDKTFAGRILPKLEANHTFWQNFSDVDNDGLAEFRWSGQAGDNSPLWDDYGSGLTGFGGCIWLPPVASVHLNCFLIRDAAHLAFLCDRLDLLEKATKWRDRRKQLIQSLQTWCWDDETRWFWDYNHHTGRHTKIKTFFMFWPIWANVPVEEHLINHMVDKVLLDPHQFCSQIPFPSVAYDEPTYDGNGYWRGRAWPHISFWLLETLWQTGRTAEADLIADRLLHIWEDLPGFAENLSTQASNPGKPGYLNYNWGIAAYLLVLERAYRTPVIPTT